MEINMETVTSPATNICTSENQVTPALYEQHNSTAIKAVLENPQSNYAAAAASSSKVMSANSDMNAYLQSFPPGYRFKPTDEELIVHYLLRKIQNKQLYPSRIHDADIYRESPFYLSANFAAANETEWYFLSPRVKKYPNGIRPDRAAGKGSWKATGADKTITSSNNKVDVGVVKTLKYHSKESSGKQTKTDWIMKEYRVRKSPPSALQEKRVHSTKGIQSNLAKSSKKCMKLDDYVLYKIYKTKSNKSNATNVEKGEANDQDHEPFENFHDDVAQQVDTQQDYGPDGYLVAGDHFNQQNHAGDNIREINYSANQQQQRQLWTNPYPNYLCYNNHVFPNNVSMVIPQMHGNGFYDQNRDTLLHGTLCNQQNVSDYDYIPPHAMLRPADGCNNVRALNYVPNISEESTQTMPPVDASSDDQAFNNEMNVSQVQQRQYKHQLVMTRPSTSSSYHPNHPQN